MNETKPARAGRPRCPVRQQAILQAAFDLLAKGGPADFTIEAVSARSGVARTTIYRRWPSKGALAVDSFRQSMRAELDFQPTASAIADLRTVYRAKIRLLQGRHGRILAGILAEGQNDPATLDAFNEDYITPSCEGLLGILKRGMESGEFRRDLNPQLVLDALLGAIYQRLLTRRPFDEAWGEAVLDLVLAGCAAAPQPVDRVAA